jgi:hypothetical protein
MKITLAKSTLFLLSLIFILQANSQKIVSTVVKEIEREEGVNTKFVTVGFANEWAKTENSEKIYNFRTSHKWNTQSMGLTGAIIQTYDNNLNVIDEKEVLQDLIPSKTGFLRSFPIQGNIKALLTTTYIKKGKKNIVKYIELNIETGKIVKSVLIKEFVKVGKLDQYKNTFLRSANHQHYAFISGKSPQKIQFYDADLNEIGEVQDIKNENILNFNYNTNINNKGVLTRIGILTKTNRSTLYKKELKKLINKVSVFAANAKGELINKNLEVQNIEDLMIASHDKGESIIYAIRQNNSYSFKISNLNDPLNFKIETDPIVADQLKILKTSTSEDSKPWIVMTSFNFDGNVYSWNVQEAEKYISTIKTMNGSQVITSQMFGDQLSYKLYKDKPTEPSVSVKKRFITSKIGSPISFEDALLGKVTFMWAQHNDSFENNIYGDNHCKSLIPSDGDLGKEKYGASLLAIFNEKNQEKNIILKNHKKEMGSFDVLLNPSSSISKLANGEYLYSYGYRTTAAMASPIKRRIVKITFEK